jgi:ACS family tartrate transporter-like MFS transporter
VTDLDRQATVRKVHRRLLPFLFLLYVVCFLDRVNVSFAALQMNRDLGFSAAMYGFGAGILFVSYALFEVPSNIILARVGARRWIARIAISWGVLSAATMFVQGPKSFYLVRFLLGAAEAGFFPGIVYYLGNWFTARERARAVGLFMTAIPLSGVIGGPLSGALLGLDGRMGLAGWQWLFLAEGIPSLVLGVIALRVLTDKPQDATWLTDDERTWISSSLRDEHARHADVHRVSLLRSLTHRTVWELGVLYALGSMGTYGLALWLPQIVKGISGSNDFMVGLITAIPNLAAAIGMVLISASSDRSDERCGHVAWCGVAAGVGLAVSAYVASPVVAIAALSVASIGINGRYGPFWALPSRFLRDEAAASGIALINSLGAVAGFAAPYAMGLVRDATHSFRYGLLMLAAMLFASAGLAWWLKREPILVTRPTTSVA